MIKTESDDVRTYPLRHNVLLLCPIFSSDSTTVGHHQQNSQSANTLEEITLTNDEVLSVLINLDNNKAPITIKARTVFLPVY
jgi:hypothetical protein